MSYNLSGCVFVRNTFKGAFCLFESMYQLLPLCDEFIVMDLGSDDGTLGALAQIASSNPKVRLVHSTFYENDAAIFAKLANDLIGQCSYPDVLYYQADEIWHEDLVGVTRRALNQGERDLSFWRVQLKYNFQRIKWFPHPVHRIAPKGDFDFVGDGMNTERTYATTIVSGYGFGQMANWENEYINHPYTLPLKEMILDVSLTGAFLDNIPDRRRMHLPFWHEGDVMPGDEAGKGVDDWYAEQRRNDDWTMEVSPFAIPEIMAYHVGKQKYELRSWLFEELKRGDA